MVDSNRQNGPRFQIKQTFRLLHVWLLTWEKWLVCGQIVLPVHFCEIVIPNLEICLVLGQFLLCLRWKAFYGFGLV